MSPIARVRYAESVSSQWPGREPGDQEKTSPDLLEDETLDYETDMVFGWETGRAPKGLVGIHRAGHFSFSELCPLNLTEVAAGKQCGCARSGPDNVWCWGDNSSGQLATGDLVALPQPAAIARRGRSERNRRIGTRHPTPARTIARIPPLRAAQTATPRPLTPSPWPPGAPNSTP